MCINGMIKKGNIIISEIEKEEKVRSKIENVMLHKWK